MIAGIEIENMSYDLDHDSLKSHLSLVCCMGLNVVYLCTKFNHSSFRRSTKIEMVHVT